MKNVVYFGSVTDVTLSKITDNTNTFSQTKLGKLAMYYIAYKVGGQEFIKFILKLICLIVFLSLYIIWWRKRMLPQSVLDLEGDRDVSFEEEDGKQILHYSIFAPSILMLMIWYVVFIIISITIIE